MGIRADLSLPSFHADSFQTDPVLYVQTLRSALSVNVQIHNTQTIA